MIGAAGKRKIALRNRSLRNKIGPALRLFLTLTLLSMGFLAQRDAPDVVATAGYSFGTENSWIRVQNIGQESANVDLSYFDESGKLAGKDACPSLTCPGMFPGSGW